MRLNARINRLASVLGTAKLTAQLARRHACHERLSVGME